ncbi:CBS domain-containing protein [Streptomyces mirabilis]|uniref:CBS domain-containing protein n=1 Tax=Streptomyces mirabilis TaxID=68239 RepID=UPI00224D2EA8|nr:CBS domain-containing protein [Streptomyces mirabilis]MCX4430152.1 CBS domain-containing protein [Streptomyces mirabilis]
MDHSPYTVNDVMTTTVVAVDPDAQFKEIVATMEKWKVSALPVLEGEGRVVGVVSEADLLTKGEPRDSDRGLIEKMRGLDDTAKAVAVSARDLMTTPAVTVRAGASLPQAASRMAYHQVKRLPVVDDDEILQGIVSRADLLKVYLRSGDAIAAEVRAEVVDRLFPVSRQDIQVDVNDGVVTVTGRVRDSELISVAIRLTHAIDGVVDVNCLLTGPSTGGAPAT